MVINTLDRNFFPMKYLVFVLLLSFQSSVHAGGQAINNEDEYEAIPSLMTAWNDCFKNWDGYLGSARACIRSLYSQQESQMLKIGLTQATVDRIWQTNSNKCNRMHSDEENSEIKMLSIYQCLFGFNQLHIHNQQKGNL